jgi:hypothetical protein
MYLLPPQRLFHPMGASSSSRHGLAMTDRPAGEARNQTVRLAVSPLPAVPPCCPGPDNVPSLSQIPRRGAGRSEPHCGLPRRQALHDTPPGFVASSLSPRGDKGQDLPDRWWNKKRAGQRASTPRFFVLVAARQNTGAAWQACCRNATCPARRPHAAVSVWSERCLQTIA